MTYLKKVLAVKHGIARHVMDLICGDDFNMPPFGERKKFLARIEELSEEQSSQYEESFSDAIDEVKSMTKKEYEDLAVEVALIQYKGGYKGHIQKILKENPKYLTSLSKGSNEFLYRAFGIDKEKLKPLLAGKSMKSGRGVSGWTTDLEVAKKFNLENNTDYPYQIIFRKKMKPTDIIVDFAREDIDDRYPEESEVLCKAVSVTSKDIFLLFKDGEEIAIPKPKKGAA